MFYVKNLPVWERSLRIIAGMGIIAIGFNGLIPLLAHYMIVLTGIITVLTGFAGFCPMCALFGRRIDK